MRIAIVKLSALGDIVHAMIVLQFIKKYNQQILIDWVVEENYKDLLDHHPHINQVHTINLKKAKINKSFSLLISDLKKLQKLQSYDFVIDMQGLIKSAICSRIIPSKFTFGYDKFSVRERFASFFYSNKFCIGYEENVVLRNFELIKFALNLPFTPEDLYSKSSFIFPHKEYQFSNLSKSKNNVIIVPGASSSSKQYPVEKIIKLTQKLDANFIIIWGNKYERSLADEINKFSDNTCVSGPLSLDKLAGLIKKADLVIGPDTGPTHFAWALNISSITLFGPTPGYRNTMLSKNNLIIESKSEVNPFKINKQDYSISEISVEEVVKMAKNLLNN